MKRKLKQKKFYCRAVKFARLYNRYIWCKFHNQYHLGDTWEAGHDKK